MNKVVECGNEGCNHIGDYEEFTNNNIGVPLCDDCYTVVCYMVADELEVNRQQLDLQRRINMDKKNLIDKVIEWLENEVYDGAEIVEAKHSGDDWVTSDGTDDIIYGRAECAESLLNQIKKWK